MSTVRERLLSPLQRLRGIADTRMGLRRYRVFIRRETTSDGRGGRGATITRVDTELAEKPRVRSASQQDVVSSGGRIQINDYILDRVTPRNDADTLGLAPGTLGAGPGAVDEIVLVVLDGPGMPAYVEGPPPSGGGEFTVVISNEAANFSFSYVIRPRTGRR